MATTPGARTLCELAIENGDQRLLLAYCSNTGRTEREAIDSRLPWIGDK